MHDLKKGIIIKIDSDKSWIFTDDGVYQSDIKKSLLRDQKPLVGDRVHIQIIHPKEKAALINNFEVRKNVLPKPKIANVHQAIVITSLKEPNFNSYLLNKYLMFLNYLKIKPILIFTKSDLINLEKDSSLLSKIQVYKSLGYETIIMSNKNPQKEDLAHLTSLLDNKLSVFVGQTGAGKSTTINRFLSNIGQIKTQEISQALNRGKHTTTSTQIYHLGSKILVADTPGFGNFDLSKVNVQDLIWGLPILSPFLGECKYQNCTHLMEKTCSLKQYQGFPPQAQFIYHDYCRVLEELKNKKGKTYERRYHNT